MIGITGATGFIGSYFLRHLTATGQTPVRVLVRETPPPEIPGLDVVRGDLRSPEVCREFADGLDCIYHFAHRNSPIDSDSDQAHDALVNLIPLLNLLTACTAAGRTPHIVYLSSGGAVYGAGQNSVPFRETDICRPTCSYGIQKLAGEHYLRVGAESGHITAACLRVGNAYGALLPTARKQGLIGVAATRVLNGEPIHIIGNPGNVRDYIHLSDLSAMLCKAARPLLPFTVVNVGSGRGHSVRRVIEIIGEVAGCDVSVVPEAGAGGSLTDWVVLDIAKAERDFGWAPAVDLTRGISSLFTEAAASSRLHLTAMSPSVQRSRL